MNRPSTRGVLPIYKEARAITARLSRSMHEWILTQTGEEPEAADSREERAQADALTAGRCEWESLLAENAPLAFRVARGVLRTDADAEDVAQEAMLRAHRRFDGLREQARFRGWLVRISFRMALDRPRANKRRQAREAEWALENSRNAVHPGDNPEFQCQFDRAMDELPEKQRLVLFLAAMGGHTLEEVSLLLAVPIGTVKSRLFCKKNSRGETAMFCESYCQLIDSLAAGEPLPPELAKHVAGCSACTSAFAEERTLFAAIEYSLGVAVNVPAPPSLLPRVRAQQETARRLRKRRA